MSASGPKSLPPIGFLTVSEHPQHGLFGGLLLLNAVGRPLEFHCTAPVRPNRAQQILYGATLEPFLFGEQIGHTLLSHAKVKPVMVVIDIPPALELRRHIQTPVLLVLNAAECLPVPSDNGAGTLRVPTEPSDDPAMAHSSPHLNQRVLRRDDAHPATPPKSHLRWSTFEIGSQPVAVWDQRVADRQFVLEHWPAYGEHIDLDEPFGRIREALNEAQPGK